MRDECRIEKNMKYTKKRRRKFGFWIFDSTFARLIDRLIVLEVHYCTDLNELDLFYARRRLLINRGFEFSLAERSILPFE